MPCPIDEAFSDGPATALRLEPEPGSLIISPAPARCSSALSAPRNRFKAPSSTTPLLSSSISPNPPQAISAALPPILLVTRPSPIPLLFVSLSLPSTAPPSAPLCTTAT